jgi:gamma-butyrobetaine dioxygenase
MTMIAEGATPERWDWPDRDERGASRLWGDLDQRGSSFFRCPEAARDGVDPARLVERMLGTQPERITVVPIKPRPQAALGPVQRRSYPGSMVAARFHVDPDPEGILPPHVQIMVCKRPADRGGETLILDVWPLLAAIERKDPHLYRRLFETPRRIRFSGNDAFGPTIAYRQHNLVCLHGAVPPTDGVGLAFRRWIEESSPFELRAEAGDVYVNNNHRTLHGRRVFDDPSREFLRILVWLRRPLAAPGPLLARARAAWRMLSARMANEAPWVRQAFGLDPAPAQRMPPAPEHLEDVLRRLRDLGNDALEGAGGP